jgi:hypothetical protein
MPALLTAVAAEAQLSRLAATELAAVAAAEAQLSSSTTLTAAVFAFVAFPIVAAGV